MTTEAKLLGGFGVATLAIIIGVAALFNQTTQTPPSAVVSAEDMTKLIREDSYHTGTSSAKLTIVEFGDFQCPACKMADPIVKQFLNDNPNEVQLVFRNFPLPMHNHAQLAAEAAEAAGAQGKFWEMNKLLYENQAQWENNGNPGEIFKEYAQSLGLDVEKFMADINSNTYKNRIDRDTQDGNDLGVRATPTFFFNGKRHEGIPQYDDFKQALEQSVQN